MKLNYSRVLRKVFIAIVVFIPLIIPLVTVLSGRINLWYDPARDLLAAWDNLHKITLIGPPSGIPGIFYGPYWIWFLSLSLLVSKDPKIVTLIVAAIPYAVFFPLVWFAFSKYFGLTSVILGWYFFMFASGREYATQLWNPFPAPILVLLAFFLLLRTDFAKPNRRVYAFTLLIGIMLGLVTSFHMSFGLGFCVGIYVFFLWQLIKGLLQKQNVVKWITYFVLVSGGILIAFIPFLVFESRHGFHQINALVTTISSSDPVVGLKGISRLLIAEMIVGTFSRLLSIPGFVGQAAFIVVLSYFIYSVKRKKVLLSETDRKILEIIFCVIFSAALIYLTAKNPVWNYHLIGLDVIFLVLTAFLAAKLPIFRKALIVWVIYIIVTAMYTFVGSWTAERSFFDRQKEIVQTIASDAGDNEYNVIVYSASIYTYEFTYLFRWLAGKDIPYDPSQNTAKTQLVYFVYPDPNDPKVIDFIHFRASDPGYETVGTIPNPSGLTVLKRVQKSQIDR